MWEVWIKDPVDEIVVHVYRTSPDTLLSVLNEALELLGQDINGRTVLCAYNKQKELDSE